MAQTSDEQRWETEGGRPADLDPTPTTTPADRRAQAKAARATLNAKGEVLKTTIEAALPSRRRVLAWVSSLITAAVTALVARLMPTSAASATTGKKAAGTDAQGSGTKGAAGRPR